MDLEQEIKNQHDAINEIIESMKKVKNESVLNVLNDCLNLHLQRLKELKNN